MCQADSVLCSNFLADMILSYSVLPLQMPIDIKPEEALLSDQAPLQWVITHGPATPNIFYNGHAVQVQDFNTVATVKYRGKRARSGFRG